MKNLMKKLEELMEKGGIRKDIAFLLSLIHIFHIVFDSFLYVNPSG